MKSRDLLFLRVVALLLLMILSGNIVAQTVPELVYYKFDVPGTTVLNEASTPVSPTGTVQGTATIGGAGQFNAALIGSGAATGTNSVNANWPMNLTGPWTMSMWFSGVSFSSNAYLFGSDGSGFRAITGVNYISGAGNLMIRGTGLTDVLLNGIFDVTGTPVVVHLVYDPAVPDIKAYINGVFSLSVPQSATMALTGTNFLVGGYGANPGLPSGAAIDEFRLYNRALTAAEITSTWNMTLPLNLTACSGMPTGGTTVSSTATACANQPFTLSVNGASPGSGFTYQWESSPAGMNAWSPIATATNASYSATQTAATDYRLEITCTNGGQSATSVPVTVNMNSFMNCYCIPTTTNGCVSGDHIINLTFGGINNTTGQCLTASYSDYKTTVAPASAGTAQSYPISMTVANGGTEYAGAWIDYDQSGTFDASEYIALTGTLVGGLWQFTGTVTVPTTALPGNTVLRVRSSYNAVIAATSACGTYSYGETEDYTLGIFISTPCSGIPSPVTASGPPDVCPGAPISLVATGFSTGLNLTYEWQMFNIGTSTWDPVPGANSPSYIITSGQTTATDYRFVTTCANGGGQDISNTVSVIMSPFYNCYCGSAPANPFDGEITNVLVGGLNNSSTCAASNQMYTDFSATIAPVPLMQASTYPVSVTAGSCGGSYAAYVKIFIDFDHDGTFTGIGEEVFAAIPPGGLYTSVGVAAIGTISIPATALTGITRMRVILQQATSAAAVVPCGSYNYGETEDYLVDIVLAQGCTGTPAAVTASGPAFICPAVPFTLSAAGYSTGLGISYEWQQFNTGTSNWDPIPSTTNPIYLVATGQTVATDYRFVTTCANGGGQDISNTVSVAMGGFLYCYCIPTTVNGCISGDHIMNVTFGGINNTTGACISGGSYSNYQMTVPAGSIAQGTSVPISVTVSNGGTEYAGAWIDFDQNGTFDASEFTPLTGVLATTWGFTGTVVVPLTATLGQTGFRVRSRYNGPILDTDACSNLFSYGETEDYVIEITVAPTCLQPTGLSVSNVTGISADVTWNSVTGATGYEYAVDQSNTNAPDASTTINTNATNTPPTVTGLSASSTYYLHVRTDCGATNGLSAWSVFSFATPPPNDPCNTATNISNQQVFTGTTSGATESLTACDATPTANDVWYTFTTGPTGGSVTVTVITTGTMDVVMQGFDGSCGALNPIVPTASTTLTGTCIDGPAAGTEFGTYTVSPNTTYYVRIYGFNSIQGTFTIQALGTPLSIKLADIYATNVGGRNRVDWKTESELSSDHFEVERSLDGENFITLDVLSAKGQASRYSYWDERPVSGVNFYRLKLVEASGRFAYSEVVHAKVNGAGSFAVEAYPNPVSDVVTIKVHGDPGSNASITITDVTGKVVRIIGLEQNETKVNMAGLAQGMYLVKYADDLRSQIIKVNKK